MQIYTTKQIEEMEYDTLINSAHDILGYYVNYCTKNKVKKIFANNISLVRSMQEDVIDKENADTDYNYLWLIRLVENFQTLCQEAKDYVEND